MKNFNLNEAKAGKPVCTRNGKKARIISYNRFNKSGYNIVALILNANSEETIRSYMNNGRLFEGALNPDDLMMKTTLHEGFVCLYRAQSGDVVTGAFIYKTQEEAQKLCASHLDCIGITKISWEE